MSFSFFLQSKWSFVFVQSACTSTLHNVAHFHLNIVVVERARRSRFDDHEHVAFASLRRLRGAAAQSVSANGVHVRPFA